MVRRRTELVNELVESLKTEVNIVSMIKQVFVTVQMGVGLIEHMTRLVDIFLTSPIELEIGGMSVQLFKGLVFPLSIFSADLQTILGTLRSEGLNHFMGVTDFSKLIDCRYNKELTQRCHGLRSQILGSMFIYILVDALEMRKGRYMEDIRQICLAAIANVKTLRGLSLSDDLFEFLGGLSLQILNF